MVVNDHPDHSNCTQQSTTDGHSHRRQPFFNVSRVALTRSSHQESYEKMRHNDDDDDDDHNNDAGETPDNNGNLDIHEQNNVSLPIMNDDTREMILTAAKLSSLFDPSSVVYDTDAIPVTLSSTINTSHC
jgi:hypothetical protein